MSSIQTLALQPSEEQNLMPNDKYKCVNDDELPPDYDSIIKGDTSDTSKQPKQGMGCISGLKATAHLKAWILTISIMLFIVFYAIWPDLYVLWIMMLIFFYIGYLVESFVFSSSFKYIRHIYVQESVYEYISRLQTYEPKIWWNIVCYHYETRYRTVTDSDGNTRTESYQEMVITHTASKNYQYKTWKDVSAPMPVLNEWNLTKLTNYKTFTFADTETENDYNTKAAAFRANNNLDVYQTFSFGVEIKDFLAKMLVEVEPGTKSEAISMPYYVISTIFLFTTCYRMYFASVCGRQKYAFNKQISILESSNYEIAIADNVDHTNHHLEKINFHSECITQTQWEKPHTVESEQIHVKENIDKQLKYDDNLPIEWQKCYTNDGKIYYQNNITKTTQWERPQIVKSVQITVEENVNDNKFKSIDNLPVGWQKHYTNDGKVYYQNNITKITQWKRPHTPQKDSVSETDEHETAALYSSQKT